MPESGPPAATSSGALLDGARIAYRRRAWGDAYTGLKEADSSSALGPGDLKLLAEVAHLVGRDDESNAAWARSCQAFADKGDLPAAARCGFYLARQLAEQGEMAQAGGWRSRAKRLVDESGQACVEAGFLLLPDALIAIGQGDAASAYDIFSEAARIGRRFKDADLQTLARLGTGRSLIMLGRVPDGMGLLDEVMVSVVSNEVSPLTVGIVYCAVIDLCRATYDIRRAQEWTAALDQWTSSQPDLIPYRGQCLVHRSEILQLHGSWPDALAEVELALGRLTYRQEQPAAGAAFYRKAEIHRVSGQFVQADNAYRRAAELGYNPQPGLSQLRLAQGQPKTAEAAMRREVAEAGHFLRRARLLGPYVEVLLAVGDLDAARAASEELTYLAAALDAPVLRGVAQYAGGAVRLASGQPANALPLLRESWALWAAVEAPYEAARVRVLIGSACRSLGDNEGAELEVQAAADTFRRLGAVPDFDAVERLRAASQPAGGLTIRELEILRQLAKGDSNRAIARELVISEKTVARHISNIFAKLDVNSRTAAAAYAHDRGLL